MYALVDYSMYNSISKYHWTLRRDNRNTYAYRVFLENGIRKMQGMHNFVTEEIGIDHINGNGLDNRLCNLRKASPQENAQNRRPDKNCKSKFKGVGWHEKDNRWRARITIDGKSVFIGNFEHEIHAAIAYDNAAIEKFGEFAWLNSRHFNLKEVESKNESTDLLLVE